MTRSRYQQRSNTCGVLLLTIILMLVVLALWTLARRGQSVAELPSPTATATFISRDVIAVLPTNTPHLRFAELPTFTVTPTASHTPTITPTPTATPTRTPTPAPTLGIEIGAALINVRQGPSTDYNTTVILGPGEAIEIVGRTEDDAWVEIRMASGENGWVLAELLAKPADVARLAVLTPPPTPTVTITPSPTTEPPPQVSSQGANLRAGPGQQYDVVAQLPPGTPLLLRGRNDVSDWLVVSTEAGQEGWLFAELVLGGRTEIAALPVRTPPPTPTPRPATPTPEPIALAAAVNGQARVERKVLANYFTWFDDASWDGCNISAGDNPMQRYNSDDPNTTARHIQMARDVGIDGFTMQWVGPGDRTDRNFATLLEKSQGTNFQSTVVSLAHYWSAGNQGAAIEGIRHLINRYSGHPNFLKVEGRPVIFFEGVDRVPRSGGSAQSAWANIRAQVDPNHTTWWIAEGLDTSYLSVFDGMWVYNVTHASSPNDYVKAARWGNNVRAKEQQTGQPKLWVATLMPGSDDSRASCRRDVRSPAPPRVRGREGGNFYRATYNAAVQSNPDLIWINSFNEWVEGTYIEPSRFYGDTFMNITRELTGQYKGG